MPGPCADTDCVTRPAAGLDDDSFASVLAAARSGDTWAAELLFVDLQPRLLRFFRATEPRAADDLAGDVWLGTARGLASFEGDLAGFRSWVFTIARRRLADHRRTAGRRGTDPVDPHEMFRERPDEARRAPDSLVIDRADAQQAIDLITSSLPEEQAELLLLRVVAGLDVAHVAEVLDRTANWVRVTQHRALRRLAEILREDSPEV